VHIPYPHRRPLPIVSLSPRQIISLGVDREEPGESHASPIPRTRRDAAQEATVTP